MPNPLPGDGDLSVTQNPQVQVPGQGQAQDPGQAQQAPEVSAEVTPTISAVEKSTCVRRDKGRLHAVRHGALARYPLEALRHLGEDGKALRRLERRFRAELKPRGIIADLLFDRFWSSYLRCLLAARTEASAFLPCDQEASKGAYAPELIQADLPTLLVGDEREAKVRRQALEPDVLRPLLLVQRYDRHFSHEMYHAWGSCSSCGRMASLGLSSASPEWLELERKTPQDNEHDENPWMSSPSSSTGTC